MTALPATTDGAGRIDLREGLIVRATEWAVWSGYLGLTGTYEGGRQELQNGGRRWQQSNVASACRDVDDLLRVADE